MTPRHRAYLDGAMHARQLAERYRANGAKYVKWAVDCERDAKRCDERAAWYEAAAARESSGDLAGDIAEFLRREDAA
jgi:hypothetical protein